MNDYDVIVLGGGRPASTARRRWLPAGCTSRSWSGRLVGGECSYWACIPSKSLLRPGEAVQGAREAGASAQVDVAAALAWRDFMVSGYSDAGQERWLASRGIGLLRAAGLGPPPEHALISLLALNGLRVSEATGADIEHLGLERWHPDADHHPQALAPRTARAIDLAIGERTGGPVFLPQPRIPITTRAVTRCDLSAEREPPSWTTCQLYVSPSSPKLP